MLRASFEDTERSHKTWNAALRLGTDQETGGPLEPPKGAQSVLLAL